MFKLRQLKRNFKKFKRELKRLPRKRKRAFKRFRRRFKGKRRVVSLAIGKFKLKYVWEGMALFCFAFFFIAVINIWIRLYPVYAMRFFQILYFIPILFFLADYLRRLGLLEHLRLRKAYDFLHIPLVQKVGAFIYLCIFLLGWLLYALTEGGATSWFVVIPFILVMLDYVKRVGG